MADLELDVVAGIEVLLVEVAVLLGEAEELVVSAESVGGAATDIVESDGWAGLGLMRRKTLVVVVVG